MVISLKWFILPIAQQACLYLISLTILSAEVGDWNLLMSADLPTSQAPNRTTLVKRGSGEVAGISGFGRDNIER